MPADPKEPNNIDRLLKHLKDGSLAARLVRAHHSPGTASPRESMAAVLKERLEQVRNSFDKD